MLQFVFHGKPITKLRARMSKSGFVYDPQNEQKKISVRSVKDILKQKDFKEVMKSAVGVKIMLHTQMPNSWSDKKKAEWVGKYDVTKPDIDNCIKFYFDVMNKLVYYDDCQICKLYSEKRYAYDPRVEVLIKEIF